MTLKLCWHTKALFLSISEHFFLADNTTKYLDQTVITIRATYL